MSVKLWFMKGQQFALAIRCDDCGGTNRTLHTLVNQKETKKKLICDKCLIHYPIAGKSAPVKFTKKKKRRMQ